MQSFLAGALGADIGTIIRFAFAPIQPRDTRAQDVVPTIAGLAIDRSLVLTLLAALEAEVKDISKLRAGLIGKRVGR